ncbi:MAG: nicotinate-nucleotide--dimethylbenzimidazole phosphoribosyltransferase [Solirubrobacterales bacterium]
MTEIESKKLDRHGCLGIFEDLQRYLPPESVRIDPAAVVLFCGDSGVSRQGTSSYQPMDSARIVWRHLNGNAYTRVAAERFGMRVFLTDVGLYDVLAHPGLLCARCGAAADWAAGEALTPDQTVRALEAGRRTVGTLAAEGIRTIGIGEIGIGGTLSASCLTAALLRLPAWRVVGAGSDYQLSHLNRKYELLNAALASAAETPCSALRSLERFGSVELAALAGAVLGAMEHGMLAVLDGFVAGTAALVAEHLRPGAKARTVTASESLEPGHRYVMNALDHQALLPLGINYGEGLAAVFALFFLEIAEEFKKMQDFIIQKENFIALISQ